MAKTNTTNKENSNIITFDMSVIQRNVATGRDQSETTKIYIMREIDTDRIHISSSDWTEEVSNFVELMAIATVHHPWIMWGSSEENISDFCRLAKDELDTRGYIEYNDFGVAFWKSQAN